MDGTWLDWARLVFPWPAIAVTALLVFRKPLSEFTRVKAGPVELERQLQDLADHSEQAVSKLHQMIEIMAASRLLELEITQTMFGAAFTSSQQNRMEEHIKQLRALTGTKSPKN